MKAVLIAVLLSIFLSSGFVFGQTANFVTSGEDHAIKSHEPESSIPNMAQPDEDVNGRPQKMDTRGDTEGTNLTPVERTIIYRDAVISNRPNMQNRAGE